jgi:hypothetical protein
MAAAGNPARESAGVWKGRSGPEGRARADASEDGWYGCACGAHARGGATRARARVSPDGVRVRQAVACRLLAARTRAASTACGILRHGLGLALTMRERQGAARERHALPGIRKTARHRPVSTPAPAAGRRWPAQGTGISPVAGQAPAREGHGICQRSNAGALPPPSTCRTLRQLRKAFLPPGPKRLRSIRRRERDECGMGARGVEKGGDFGELAR